MGGGAGRSHGDAQAKALLAAGRFRKVFREFWVLLGLTHRSGASGELPIRTTGAGRRPGGAWSAGAMGTSGHGGAGTWRVPVPPLPGTHTCRGTKAELFSEDGEPEAEAQPVRMKRTPLSPRRQEGRPGPSPGASQLPTPGPAPSLRSSLRPPRVPPRATGGQACSWAGAHDTLRKEGPPGLKSRGSTGDAKRRLGRGEGVLVIKGGREGPVPRGDRCKCTGETAVVSQGIRSSLPPCHPE